MTPAELLPVLRAQHDAIDILMARLVQCDPKFLPTKSGEPWDAIVAGYKAIKQLEKEAAN